MSSLRLRPWSVGLATVAVLGGCRTVGPDYHAPSMAVPASFATTASTTGPTLPADEPWWRVFRDPELDRLEQRLLAQNPTLASAEAARRVVEAQLLGVRAAERPGVALNANAQLAGESATQSVPGTRLTYRSRGDRYSIPLQATYEIDLWGRIRRQVEGATATVAASDADVRAATLSLTATLAQTYFQWRTLQVQLVLSERAQATRRDTVDVLGRRFQAGLAPALDLAKAREQVAAADAELAILRRRLEEAAHALAALVGEAPASPSVAGEPWSSLPPAPDVPAGLPATLLRRRPDLVSAERQLAARTAEIGVAEAARFPTISLTAQAGVESSSLRTLVNQSSQLWGIGPSVTLPILDGGKIDAGVAAAKARTDAALADYRAKVLDALREVEDALTGLHFNTEEAEARRRAISAARDTADLTRIRYERGLINYLDVASTETAAFGAQLNAAQVEGDRLVATVHLIKAIGGVWE